MTKLSFVGDLYHLKYSWWKTFVNSLNKYASCRLPWVNSPFLNR